MADASLPKFYKSPEYRSWSMARNRCRNPRADNFRFYGGRGITFSSKFDSFAVFIEEVGPRPAGFQLERVDNSKGYEPGNVRWASRQRQCNNRRTNHVLAMNGRSQSISDWGRELGIRPLTIQARIASGWSAEKALTTPVRRWP